MKSTGVQKTCIEHVNNFSAATLFFHFFHPFLCLQFYSNCDIKLIATADRKCWVITLFTWVICLFLISWYLITVKSCIMWRFAALQKLVWLLLHTSLLRYKGHWQFEIKISQNVGIKRQSKIKISILPRPSNPNTISLAFWYYSTIQNNQSSMTTNC